MVKPEYAAIGTKLQMDILGNLHEVTVIQESPYDPENHKLRA